MTLLKESFLLCFMAVGIQKVIYLWNLMKSPSINAHFISDVYKSMDSIQDNNRLISEELKSYHLLNRGTENWIINGYTFQ